MQRRLTTAWRSDQARLDCALAKALVDGRPGLVTLHAAAGASPIMALVLPVRGEAKNVFVATSVIVVFVDPARRQESDDVGIPLLDEAAGLTRREIDVVRLVGMGRSPKDAADVLGIGYDTTRNHLKSAFAKLGVHSQGELVTLIQHLR